MEDQIIAMYPECGKCPHKCMDKYVRDRLAHMDDMGLCMLKLSTFERTYDHVFKAIEEEFGGRFWHHTRSWNVGTIKDKYVYSFQLYLKKASDSDGDAIVRKLVRSGSSLKVSNDNDKLTAIRE